MNPNYCAVHLDPLRRRDLRRIERHNRRLVRPAHVDADRTRLNREYCREFGDGSFRTRWAACLQQNHCAEPGADRIIAAELVVWLSRETADIEAVLDGIAHSADEQFGRSRIISLIAHRDEKSPHVHVVFVPVVESEVLPRGRLGPRDRKGSKMNVCSYRQFVSGKAKGAEAVECSKKYFADLQTKLAAALACFGYVRGDAGTKRRQIRPPEIHEHQESVRQIAATVTDAVMREVTACPVPGVTLKNLMTIDGRKAFAESYRQTLLNAAITAVQRELEPLIALADAGAQLPAEREAKANLGADNADLRSANRFLTSQLAYAEERWTHYATESVTLKRQMDAMETDVPLRDVANVLGLQTGSPGSPIRKAGAVFVDYDENVFQAGDGQTSSSSLRFVMTAVAWSLERAVAWFKRTFPGRLIGALLNMAFPPTKLQGMREVPALSLRDEFEAERARLGPAAPPIPFLSEMLRRLGAAAARPCQLALYPAANGVMVSAEDDRVAAFWATDDRHHTVRATTGTSMAFGPTGSRDVVVTPSVLRAAVAFAADNRRRVIVCPRARLDEPAWSELAACRGEITADIGAYRGVELVADIYAWGERPSATRVQVKHRFDDVIDTAAWARKTLQLQVQAPDLG